MKVIQITEDRFNELFKAALDKLKLRSLETGSINVRLNSQPDVDNFINQLHRQFHYEVVTLQRELEKKF
jgi:hypothetical protein